MDGNYEAVINTPMGNMNAKIELRTNGNTLNGVVDVMGMKNNITGGKVNGNKCYFSGKIQNGVLNLQYEIAGELVGNVLNICARTNMGEFKLQAKRVNR